ncbi:shikimate kinase [Parvularcula sp. IMCC14364]|uniref:shikimate kinase n=1 Tax=Parvularcula sp. IMCC14364 TaxID=3067902 RepID=UPI002740BCFF|nr:shikimate kinase [Parvularcula sp. IMCC14364]
MARTSDKLHPDAALNDKTIVLVGIMGVGKTTVGRRLASLLKMPFFDADAEIELAAGMPVAEFFERYGEKEFRKGERRVMSRLLDQAPHVLATGGGAFADEMIRSLIQKKAISVWLQADLKVLIERTSRRDTRPLLKDKNPAEVLTRLLEERTPFYEQADIHIACKEGPHMRTAEKILQSLNNFVH